MNKKIFIYTDGASRGNPGKAGIGAVILNEAEETVKEISKYIGETTNNVAEYTAVIEALKEGLSLGAEEVHLKSDSQLLIRQLTGEYKVKNAGLKPLYKEVKELLAKYKKFNLEHIPRENNKSADKLANEGIDMAEI